MLKIFHQGVEPLHNFKCGEIFYITAAVFKVSCLICGSKMYLDQFAIHFQEEHLSLVEECISLEDVEMKPKFPLANESSILELNPIKIEVPTVDSRKQKTVSEFLDQPISVPEEKSINANKSNVYDDKEDVCLQDSMIESKTGREKLRYSDEDNDGGDISVKSKKRSTRSSNKTNKLLKEEKTKSLLSAADGSKEIIPHWFAVITNSDQKDSSSSMEESGNFNSGVDMQWTPDEKYSNSDSNVDLDSKDELPFPCLICKRSYRTKHSLQKHNHRVHNPNKSPGKKRTATQPQHKCDQCNLVFRSARDLQGHKWKHTGIFCDICGKTFSQTGNMLRHKIRHTGIKDFKCKECNKDFFTSKELKSHMICHTGLMPMICEVCGKRCRDRGVLTAHMRRHTGERPAKCEVCGKCFFSVHDLNVHAVAHTDARPFKCDICGATFQRKKALRIHKMIHSKDRKHVCKICGKSFAQSGGLNSHMRTHDAAVEKSLTKATDTNSGEYTLQAYQNQQLAEVTEQADQNEFF